MGYVEGHLLPGEKVVYRAHLHWILFAWPVAVAVLAIPLLFVQPLIGAIVLLAGIVLAVPPLIRYTTSEYAVTDKRVIIKLGLIQRDAMETLLSKVEAIGVDQTIGGRLLNYGTLTITGTGGTKESFPMIHSPMEFRRQVQSQIVALEDRRVAAGSAAPALAEPREERECPYCAEKILKKARVCRFCGRDVAAVE